jgi:hypothetical protein
MIVEAPIVTSNILGMPSSLEGGSGLGEFPVMPAHVDHLSR